MAVLHKYILQNNGLLLPSLQAVSPAARQGCVGMLQQSTPEFRLYAQVPSFHAHALLIAFDNISIRGPYSCFKWSNLSCVFTDICYQLFCVLSILCNTQARKIKELFYRKYRILINRECVCKIHARYLIEGLSECFFMLSLHCLH